MKSSHPVRESSFVRLLLSHLRGIHRWRCTSPSGVIRSTTPPLAPPLRWEGNASLDCSLCQRGEGKASLEGTPYGSSVSGGTKVRITWGRTPQAFFMGLLRPTRYRAKRKELHLLHFLHLSRNAKLSTID